MFRTHAARVAIAGTGCLAVLAGMLVLHAWPLWTGETVYLEVQPIDPRDLFRGDYVTLTYTVQQLTVSEQPGRGAVTAKGTWWERLRTLPEQERAGWWIREVRGRTFYVELERQPAPGLPVPHVARALAVSDAPENGALNLRGTGEYSGFPSLRLDYGLDAFYVPEGSGRAIEEAMRSPGSSTYAEVAVSKSGVARIRALIVNGKRIGG